MNLDDSIRIRSIQHYFYCPRRFALNEINGDWSENSFVVKANILHEHVHDGSHNFSDSKKIVRSNISIYNNLSQYNIYGKTDCVEFIKNKNGTEILELNGRFNINLVEYKPKAPKGIQFNESDAIQVFAQKICADFVWKCNSQAYIYYDDIRKRVKLPFDEEYNKYDDMLKRLLAEMREILNKNEIPLKRKKQKCSGCSMSDICFPKSKRYSVKDAVMSQLGVDIL